MAAAAGGHCPESMMSQAVSPVWQPSTARSVAVNGLLPLPRGVIPADLPPLVWPAKDPGDVLDYAIDLSAAFAGDPTDQVATVGVTVQPNGNAGDLQVGRILASGTSAVMWLSAGIAGTNYAVQITVGTLKGRIIGRSVLLPVQQLLTVTAATNPLLTEAGTIITDQNGNPILISS
jgi:hypothetical protein